MAKVVSGTYRVTKAVTHNGVYYAVGDVVENDGSLARLFGWTLQPKTQAKAKAGAASPKKGARKPAAKKK